MNMSVMPRRTPLAGAAAKVTSKDDQNREFHVTFEPGSGPRIMRSGNANNDCVWIFTPKK